MKKLLISIFGLIIITCNAQSNSNEPQKNFSALCDLFSLNYASFEEKKIDWESRCDEFQKRISPATTDSELFQIMTELLKPLNDAHVRLVAKNLDSSFSATRESRIMKELQAIPRKKIRQEFKLMTNKTLAQNGFEALTEIGPKFRGVKLFAFTKNEKIGYLRFDRSFSTMAVMNGLSLNSQLDKIFNSFHDMEAIILDVRFNMGGDDEFSKKIAGRFVDKQTIGFYKQTRSDGEFGEIEIHNIEPKGKTPFLKNTILLTNDKTVSAADVLALMMSELSNVTLIGEPSNGSYSDLTERKLPNEWKVILSNQRYFSVNKQNFEGLGTPVDIEIKNTLEDVKQYEDSVLLKALEFLNN